MSFKSLSGKSQCTMIFMLCVMVCAFVCATKAEKTDVTGIDVTKQLLKAKHPVVQSMDIGKFVIRLSILYSFHLCRPPYLLPPTF
jgi:hypothetical protein